MLKVRDLMVNILPQAANRSGVDANYLSCTDCTCSATVGVEANYLSCTACTCSVTVGAPMENELKEVLGSLLYPSQDDLMSKLQEQLKMALAA
ncbi:hypothetical protein [Okeania sp.]|uniref:hypothetical protein n=1 Tax=Okeania sp. TaxID=3100323 RepID=UPI002B4B8FF2|nr:hypothetical protein [Okeania sp.]MEB3342235.1 hypothetical protein [Okeania sp.]